MRIAVIDNGGQWTHRIWRVLCDEDIDAEIVQNDTPVEEVIGFDGIILSGGAPRIEEEAGKLGNIGRYVDEAKVPILGICVGHQYLAVHYGGKAGPADAPEFGKATITISEEDSLFKGLPSQMVVWLSHNDEVTELPEGWRTLAHSEGTPVQAFEWPERSIYGVQFHPEVDHSEYGREILGNFVEVCRAKMTTGQ